MLSTSLRIIRADRSVRFGALAAWAIAAFIVAGGGAFALMALFMPGPVGEDVLLALGFGGFAGAVPSGLTRFRLPSHQWDAVTPEDRDDRATVLRAIRRAEPEDLPTGALDAAVVFANDRATSAQVSAMTSSFLYVGLVLEVLHQAARDAGGFRTLDVLIACTLPALLVAMWLTSLVRAARARRFANAVHDLALAVAPEGHALPRS
ncbi:hypothetical protein DEI92_03820 [Curtobacterium sp. MCBD17_034]|uniref:hypothetical protein n=1 Tax=unclassified Curtobacterium TaxID=257496 RepID=UPI000DA74C0D|nr:MULTISPECIES: hypothetical protein [unclassified Curtobacterium]PZF60792.1 hypothetical protein DEI92_03820 [Curtobacterium sp. MCBD17_034]PZM40141.1 hypothetical protein DEI90_00055 [Curtobacterium sp. MCBD17_031]